jgi:hypothetical protein
MGGLPEVLMNGLVAGTKSRMVIDDGWDLTHVEN